MTANADSEKDSDSERRRWNRIALAAAADVTASIGNESYDCTIVDLSVGGAQLAFSEDVQPCDRIAVHHDTLGRLSGECVWQSASNVGVKFHESDVARNSANAHSCP